MPAIRNTFHVAKALVTTIASAAITGGSLYARYQYAQRNAQALSDALNQMGINPNEGRFAELRDKFMGLVGGSMPTPMMISEGLRVVAAIAAIVCAVWLIKLIYRVIRWLMARGGGARAGYAPGYETEDDPEVYMPKGEYDDGVDRPRQLAAAAPYGTPVETVAPPESVDSPVVQPYAAEKPEPEAAPRPSGGRRRGRHAAHRR